MATATHAGRKISVIVPCYNEADNIAAGYQRISAVLAATGCPYEIIYVDNASLDRSDAVFRELAAGDDRVTVILMARNGGSPQPSYLAGLQYCDGDCAVLLDGDLQDPPELIPQFLAKWREGYDAVYGIRVRRQTSWLRQLAYKGFYRLFKRLAYIAIPLDAGDFSLLDRKVIDAVAYLPERDLYVRGVRAYVGFKQTGIPYERPSRTAGASDTNWFKDLYWAITLIINFSFKPLEWLSKIALTVVAVAAGLIVIYLVAYLVNPTAPRGIPTVVLLTLFMGGVQLLGIAIIGEYLRRMFVEVKGRPRFVVREILNDDRSLAPAAHGRRLQP